MLTSTSYSGRWAYPTQILFGPGIRHAAATEVASFGRRALLVSDRGIRAAGLLDGVIAELNQAGVEISIFDDVHANPLGSDVMEGLRAYQASAADMLIAVGGGSPLDVAKAIRLLVAHEPPLERYDDLLDGGRHVARPLPPLIAYPTTSGTGSEVSRSTVITLASSGKKTVICAPPLMPTLAVCDPELTLGLSPRLTAATGADALTHAVEAYLAHGFHPFADTLALQAVTYVFQYLRRAVLNPNDLQARTFMMLASMQGAMAFQKGLGACHAMAHPLSSIHGLHHGTANAICLPAVVAFNALAVPERIRELDRAAGNRVGLLSNVDAAEHFLQELRALFADVALPGRLRDVDLPSPHIDALAEGAFADGCHKSNPRAVTQEDFVNLYREVA